MRPPAPRRSEPPSARERPTTGRSATAPSSWRRRPTTFVIETEAHLDGKRGRPWDAHFSHRYDIAPEDDGSRITYSETLERVNYVPDWLQPLAPSIFKV
jgi:hypothetical protein